MANKEAERHDLVIIGGGPAGYVGAIRAAQLGLDTAIVEKDRAFGGTCLLRGCIPTKAMLHAADLWAHSNKLKLLKGDYALDFDAVNKHKERTVERLAKGVEGLLKKGKVSIYKGTGSLTSATAVRVTGEDGERQLEAGAVLLATGSAPRSIPGLELDEQRIVSSDGMLRLSEIPKRLVVLGAGAVGVEFASIYRRFGSEVTIVELLDRMVPMEDEEVSAELARAFRRFGIKQHLGSSITKAEQGEGGTLRLEGRKEAEKEPFTLETDLLLVAVGRRPVTDGLGLEQQGIETDRGFVPVDEYQRTNVPSVYAAGDIVPGPQLAHKASAEALVAVEHVAGLTPRPINYERVPGATYCDPEIGSVGLSEAQARERGYDVKVGRFPFTALGRAVLEGTNYGFVKIVGEARYDEVLGIHIIGPKATELIAEACVAVGLEATSEELARIIHAHPTLAEAIGEAAHGVQGSPLHL